MEQYFTWEIDKNLNERLSNLSISAKSLTSFKNFKKEFYWLAEEFDMHIESFYLHENLQKAKLIPISEIIKKEIELFFWIKSNSLIYLLKNWEDTFLQLKNLRSAILPYYQVYQQKFKDNYYTPRLIYNNFLEKWHSLIVERIVSYKLHQTLIFRQKYLLQWTNNIKIIPEVEKQIGFAWNFFGKFWMDDWSKIQKINLSIIIQYANFLESNPAILEITRMLGRFKGVSEKLETKLEEKSIIQYQQKPFDNLPEEVIGITLGRTLEHLLPSELVNLLQPDLHAIFYKRLIEEKLSILEFESIDLVATEVKTQVPVKHNIAESEGPIIICIDTSKSMKGSPEIIAKSVSLAVAKLAIQDNRPCYMINFSGTFETYDLSSLNASIPNLVHFLEKSFLGHTNINPAFNHILEILKNKQYINADLLLISDFMSSDLTQDQILKLKRLQEYRNRFYAINVAPVELNNNWSQYFNAIFNYDPRDPWAMRKVFFKIKKNF